MMKELYRLRHFAHNYGFIKSAMVLLLCLILIQVGWSIGNSENGVRILLLTTGLVFGFLLIITKGFERNVLIIASCSLILGWRGLSLTPQFSIYPTEAILWLGVIVYFARGITIAREKLDIRIPWYSFVLALFALSSIFVALTRGQSIGWALIEMKAFLIFIPALILFRAWINTISQLRFYLVLFLFSGVIIAGMGIAERYVPFLSSALPQLFPTPINVRSNFLAGGEVELANFSSWGGPIVSTILVTVLGAWTGVMRISKGISKWLWALAGGVLVFAVIITGYRSAWIGLFFTVGVAFLLLGSRNAFLLSIFGGLSLRYLPHGYIERLGTILLLTESGDTAILRRSAALEDGFHRLLNHFLLGTGWNSPTVFNDWVYLAVVLGVPGLLFFILWYVVLLYKLMMVVINPSTENDVKYLAAGFVAGLVGTAVSMVSGTLTQVPPLMMAFWFFFCLAWRFTEISESQRVAPQSEAVLSHNSDLAHSNL